MLSLLSSRFETNRCCSHDVVDLLNRPTVQSKQERNKRRGEIEEIERTTDRKKECIHEQSKQLMNKQTNEH